MRKAYRILADLIAIGVAVQAMLIVMATAGLLHWVEDGGALDSAAAEKWEDGGLSFQGADGLSLHSTLGMMVIPLIAVAFLVVAFFAGVAGGVRWAAITLVLVVVQVAAGVLGEDAPWIGLIHGLNAFALFSVALVAARAAHPETQTAVTAAP